MKIVLFNYTQNHQTDIIKKNINPDNYNIINSVDLIFDDFYGYKNVWTCRYENVKFLKKDILKCLGNQAENVNISIFNPDDVALNTMLDLEIPIVLINLIKEYTIFGGNLFSKNNKINGSSSFLLHKDRYIISIDYKYLQYDRSYRCKFHTYDIKKNTNTVVTYFNINILHGFMKNNANINDNLLLFNAFSNKFKSYDVITKEITSYKDVEILENVTWSWSIRISNSELLTQSKSKFIKVNLDTGKYTSYSNSKALKYENLYSLYYIHIPKIKSVIIAGKNPAVFNYELMQMKLIKKGTLLYNIIWRNPQNLNELIYGTDSSLAPSGDIYFTNNKINKKLKDDGIKNWWKIIIHPVSWEPDTWITKKIISFDNRQSHSLVHIFPDGKTAEFEYDPKKENHSGGSRKLFLYNTDSEKIKYIMSAVPRKIHLFYLEGSKQLMIISTETKNKTYFNIYE